MDQRNTSQTNDEDKWLQYAKNLNFTQAHYEGARKVIANPEDAGHFLEALLEVKRRDSQINTGQEAFAQNPRKLVSPQVSNDQDLISWSSSLSSSSSLFSATSGVPTSSSNSDQWVDCHKNNANQQLVSSLRSIYIDGSNVARTHGKDASYSWTGIKLAFDWFKSRGHRVKVFIPAHKCAQADDGVLRYLRESNSLIVTASHCNDDMFIIEAARLKNGVILSNDLFREEKRFNSELQSFVNNNRLAYVFDDDIFIPAPQISLGRSRVPLDEFLRCSQDRFTGERNFKLSLTNRSKSYNAKYQKGPDRRPALGPTTSFKGPSHHGQISDFLNANMGLGRTQSGPGDLMASNQHVRGQQSIDRQANKC